jgi:hypothetical protein
MSSLRDFSTGTWLTTGLAPWATSCRPHGTFTVRAMCRGLALTSPVVEANKGGCVIRQGLSAPSPYTWHLLISLVRNSVKTLLSRMIFRKQILHFVQNDKPTVGWRYRASHLPLHPFHTCALALNFGSPSYFHARSTSPLYMLNDIGGQKLDRFWGCFCKRYI